MKNPSGLCMCGCGNPTPRSPKSRRGYKRGEALMYIKGHSSRKQGPEYIENETSCWIWQRSITTHGYGHGGRNPEFLAHRRYYEERYGPLEAGVELHHLCGRRSCVNPEHLTPVDRRTHMQLEGRKAYGRYPVKAMSNA